MGNNTSCLATSKSLHHHSINMDDTFRRKKINPLQYIQPLGCDKEDFATPTTASDIELFSFQSMAKETLTLRDGK